MLIVSVKINIMWTIHRCMHCFWYFVTFGFYKTVQHYTNYFKKKVIRKFTYARHVSISDIRVFYPLSIQVPSVQHHF